MHELAEAVMRNAAIRARQGLRKSELRREPKVPIPRTTVEPWNQPYDYSEMRLYLCDSVRQRLAELGGKE